MTPAHLSSCMLRQVKYNLNTLSHDTARAMIDRMINHFKFNIAEIYVDTVGKPEFYQEKLQNWFPRISITVASKVNFNLNNFSFLLMLCVMPSATWTALRPEHMYYSICLTKVRK